MAETSRFSVVRWLHVGKVSVYSRVIPGDLWTAAYAKCSKRNIYVDLLVESGLFTIEETRELLRRELRRYLVARLGRQAKRTA